MKYFSKFRKKAVIALFLAAFLAALLYIFYPARRFHTLLTQLFREEMSADTLSMHYVLADPEDYGIPDQPATLPLYSPNALAASREQAAQTLRQLDEIPAFFIKKEDRLLYELLKDQLTLRQLAAHYLYYEEPLSPSSGLQSNLPILFAEYTFRSKEDVEDYLTLLSLIPAYFDSIADYEKEKSQMGLFMSDTCADKVIDQCYQIMERDKLENGTHFMITTFEERLRTLSEENILTPEEAAAYQSRNKALLLDCVMPAYETLGDEMLLLKGSGVPEQGLAHLPEGREYYALLFRQTTGCDRSMEEVKEMLTYQLQKDSRQLSRMIEKNPALLSLSHKDFFPTQSPEEDLEDLCIRMQADFPDFPKTDIPPSHTIKQVDESLEDYCSPAFYLTPPIDDITENSIYINRKENPSGLELYTTLAHEGYPGHLYQTVYHQLYQQKTGSSPARSLFHYGSYSEGWALYVEMLSYDYAKELLKEKGASDEILQYTDILRLNRSIQLCLYSLLDIAIHYDGADLQQVSTALAGFGITGSGIAEDIYEYIVEEPVNYPKYYVGYLEFQTLKENAQTLWKEDYSDLRFHQTILETGPCPFRFLQEEIENEVSCLEPEISYTAKNSTALPSCRHSRAIFAFL